MSKDIDTVSLKASIKVESFVFLSAGLRVHDSWMRISVLIYHKKVTDTFSLYMIVTVRMLMITLSEHLLLLEPDRAELKLSSGKLSMCV